MPKAVDQIVAEGGIRIPTSAGAGKILESDASGNAAWATAAGQGVQRAACRISRATSTAVTTSGFTTCGMDTEDIDNDSLHAGTNAYISITRAGLWLCQGVLAYGSNGTGRRLSRIAHYNSSDVFQREIASAGGAPNATGDGTPHAMSGFWNFAVNDRIYLQGYHVSESISWAGSWLSVLYMGTL